MSKQRLDRCLHVRYPEQTRNRIQQLIRLGAVTVDGIVVKKPGSAIDSDAVVVIDFGTMPYVSRAGQKLAHALDVFAISVKGLRVLDAGLSTGGFADCLLQRGAKHVYGVDVGTAQAQDSLRSNSRLTVVENTDIRDISLALLGGTCVDMVTLDLSFISITKVLAHVYELLCCQDARSPGIGVFLIKPQFEVGKGNLSKSGIVRDPKQVELVVERVKQALFEQGFTLKGFIESPILGGSGNKEFLVYVSKKSVAS